jgi:glucosamine--fructose-6-phosphate aminotransferase (isomerizing)
MCGIVGYLGDGKAVAAVLEGLTLLQNRGYDSVGVSTISSQNTGNISTVKFASTTNNNSLQLVSNMFSKESADSSIAIGHTRWATHGSKTDANAHPHHDNGDRISLVHNGIIENFQPIKSRLVSCGYFFKSYTDTEVIAVLIGFYLDQGEPIAAAIQKAVDELHGTWALVIIHRDYPDHLWAIRNGSPLLLGEETECVMVASEQIAFHSYIKNYISINDHELFEIKREPNLSGNCGFIYNKNIAHYKRSATIAAGDLTPAPYTHWMLKEIMEQSESVARAINNGGRIQSDIEVKLGGLDKFKAELMQVDHLILLGCGTSYHSGLWAQSIFKSLRTFDTVTLYDGADFSPVDIPNRGRSAAVLISQSGETKDLHRCIQIIQENNMMSIGVVNVIDSFIARETNCGIYLNAGREVAVASTKSFTNQCVVLSLLAIWFSQNKGTCEEKRRKIIKDMYNLGSHIKDVLQWYNPSDTLILKIRDARSLFVLGKGPSEAVAKEGALKIKEVTYIHAEGYSSSALKHGPFGLLEPGLPVILLDVHPEYRDKIENVKQEVIARGAYVIQISDNEEFPQNTTFGSLLANICLQIISYRCAVAKRFDPDYPRNLAKVVTVE